MKYNRDYNNPSSNYNQCMSDSSISSCHKSNNSKNSINLDYRYLEENINKLNEGTVYILKLIEEKGYNENGDFTLGSGTKRDEFLEKYGPHLYDICCQLRELGVTNLRYSEWNDIVVSKITIDNIKFKQVSFYYASDKIRDDKFLSDMNEMLKSGFQLYKFSPVVSEIRHGYGIQGWTEWVHKGFIATFEKII